MLTAGIDLSVGMVFVLGNCVASYLVAGSMSPACSASSPCSCIGLACGAMNGLVVVYGRLQPIVTTLATGAIYFGIALFIRPDPGSAPDFNQDIADAADRQAAGRNSGEPGDPPRVWSLVVWIPFRRSSIGRVVYAAGSSENAAFMSGLPIRRAKFVAYTLSGLLASMGGLFVTFVSYSAEASAANGGTYTLNSIASVVLGGVSLFGGSGSAIGAIFGAFILRTIGDLLFVFDLDPLWQPLFQGVVLLVAVCLGSVRLFQIRNRLDLYG